MRLHVHAENVASKWGITRKDQDDFALSSQNKTEKAQKEENAFKNEMAGDGELNVPKHTGEEHPLEKS